MSATFPIHKLPPDLVSFQIGSCLSTRDLARASSASTSLKQNLSNKRTLLAYFERNVSPVIQKFAHSLMNCKEFRVKKAEVSSPTPVHPITEMFHRLFTQLKPEAPKKVEKAACKESSTEVNDSESNAELESLETQPSSLSSQTSTDSPEASETSKETEKEPREENFLEMLDTQLLRLSSGAPTTSSVHEVLNSIKGTFCRLLAQLKTEEYEAVKKSVSPEVPTEILGNLFLAADLVRSFTDERRQDEELFFETLFSNVNQEKDDVEVGIKTTAALLGPDEIRFFAGSIANLNEGLLEKGNYPRALQLCKWLAPFSTPQHDVSGYALAHTMEHLNERLVYAFEKQPRLKYEKNCLEDFFAAAKKIQSKKNQEKALSALYCLSMKTPNTDVLRDKIEFSYKQSQGSGIDEDRIVRAWVNHSRIDKANAVAHRSPQKLKLLELISSILDGKAAYSLSKLADSYPDRYEMNFIGGFRILKKEPVSLPKRNTASSELLGGSKNGFLGTRKSLKAKDTPASTSGSASSSSLNVKKRKEPASSRDS